MLSDSLFARVICNLRVADASCYAEAKSRRAAYRPTRHAKRRALQADLRVDTGKAARLSSMEAYAMRYPQIIQTYSPVDESNSSVSTTAWVAGPTANDLLDVNDALVKHARTAQPAWDNETCDRLQYPTSTHEVSRVSQPLPAHSSGILSYPGVLSSDLLAPPIADATSDLPTSLKIRINIKRKHLGEDDHQCYVEKRPKYGRKRWVVAFQHDFY